MFGIDEVGRDLKKGENLGFIVFFESNRKKVLGFIFILILKGLNFFF